MDGGASAVGQQGTGRAVFAVRWPERGGASRLVPVASESVKITLKRGGTTVAERVLSRPPQGSVSEATFENLPLGDGTATATAYPAADGTGVAQATATVPVTVAAGDNTPIRLTMASTIANISLEPISMDLAVGQVASFSLSAKNADGEIVLTLPRSIRWESNPASVASVDEIGKITALSPGSTVVTGEEVESGLFATATVQVSPLDHSEYRIFELPPSGGNSSRAYAINDVGKVVGASSAHSDQTGLLNNFRPAMWSANQPGVPVLLGLLPGTDKGYALGISESSMVVGVCSPQPYFSTANTKAFLWSAYSLFELGPAGGRTWPSACAIDDSGLIAGYTSASQIGRRGTYWKESLVSFMNTGFSLPSGSGLNNEVTAIGGDRKLVGFTQASVGIPRVMVWQLLDGDAVQTTELGPGRALGANRLGDFVGSLVDEATQLEVPALYRGEQAYRLGLLPGSNTGAANGCNDAGRVVGYVRLISGDGERRAFLWEPVAPGSVTGTIRDLNALIPEGSGWTLTEARDINNKGYIVGWGERNGVTRAFVMIPKTPPG